MAAKVGALNWEELRKQARHLENDVDLKLVAFSKMGGSSSGSLTPGGDKAPLLGEHICDNMAMEIEGMLDKLSALNERMSELPASGAAMLHTIQRHREILQGYRQEFRKTQSNHNARREREELLRDGDSSIVNNPASVASGLSRRDQYLKESSHLSSSHNLINDQISIAVETREHLLSQRQTFKKIRTRFNDISNRFPAFNNLIQKIHLRKRRDSLLIGAVVAVCTILLLLYAFH